MSAPDPDQIITADDLIRGGACYSGVMESANEKWPAAFTVRVALAEAKRRGQTDAVRRALNLDGYGYGDGYGDGNGNGYGYGNGNGNGYGDGYGDGDGGYRD